MLLDISHNSTASSSSSINSSLETSPLMPGKHFVMFLFDNVDKLKDEE